MKRDPENLVLRNLYWTKRKHYKILTKQAKQKAVDRLHKQLLHFRKVNHQKFWNIILKARNVNSCSHIPIPVASYPGSSGEGKVIALTNLLP